MHLYIPLGLFHVFTVICMVSISLVVQSILQRQQIIELERRNLFARQGLVVSNDLLMTKITELNKHLERGTPYR